MMHSDNPFLPEPGERNPVRRFRGRHAAGVTIVTAGSESHRTGLTVSSLVVIEGEPGRALFLVGPTTDLWDIGHDTGRFVIHICRSTDRRLADAFAGLAPSPGGLFTLVETGPSNWGPVIADLPDRLYCSFLSREEVGWSGVVQGKIDQVEVSDLTDPLVHFRSAYRRLGDRV